jgi:putative ubiquitin-RnfH superfamily antitoxin RatB of RatAB toxin-antitoxin module
MVAAESIEVHVVYALPDRQSVYTVRVPAGTTIIEAIRHSGVLADFSEIVLSTTKLGIYGRKAEPNQAVRAGDRIEIYRPLTADPKVVRRERAERKKKPAAL